MNVKCVNLIQMRTVVKPCLMFMCNKSLTFVCKVLESRRGTRVGTRRPSPRAFFLWYSLLASSIWKGKCASRKGVGADATCAHTAAGRVEEDPGTRAGHTDGRPGRPFLGGCREGGTLWDLGWHLGFDLGDVSNDFIFCWKCDDHHVLESFLF